jgi:hypothetical protein
MEVICNGIMYYINKEPTETNEMLAARAWFIAKKSPLTIEEFLSYQHLSLYWANVNFMGCVYPNPLMLKIQADLTPRKKKNKEIIQK